MCECLSETEKIELIKKGVKSYSDFPKQGIVFMDIFSVLLDPQLSELLHDVLLSHVKSIKPPIEYICGIESRGFLLGPVLALDLKVPFVPVRKRGKLPGKVVSVTYDLEYGQDTIEVQEDTIKKGGRTIIIDDLLATGGTLGAALKLIKSLGAHVVECLIIIELPSLNGRSKVDIPVHSIMEF